MKNTTMFLIVVFILGTILRFYHLGETPVGLHRDEAFLGYNAYSLLKTARDMSGHFLPLHLESFLYSPAGYSYFSIPFIKLFGLNTFSVRFASALFGSLTIIIAYFLTKELFRNSSTLTKLALLTAGFLAISPWHINLSRTATENVLVLFFIVLGILIFLHWIKKGQFYLLVLVFACFELTLFLYQAPRTFLPFFIPSLFALFWRELDKKKIFQVLILYVVTIVIPLTIILHSSQLSLRIKTVSIFATEETQLVIDEQIREDGVSNISPIVSRGFHNKILGYSGQFLENYFKHFSFEFFFTDKGLPVRYHVPLVGLLYIFELPLLIIGVIYLLRRKEKRATILLVSWIFLVPIGSALTFDDVPNLQRTLVSLPCFSILSAIGLAKLWSFFSKKALFANMFNAYMVIIIGCSLVVYLHQYYIHGPLYKPWYRQDGYKELVEKVNTFLPSYQKAIITDRESAPTIFFLFYSKYDPAKFQRETKESTMRDFDRINFGKYIFSQEECPLKESQKDENTRVIGEKDTLYINSGLCKPFPHLKTLGDIKRTDGSTVFSIVVK